MGIYFSKVSFKYAKRSSLANKVVNDVTFSIPEGQFVVIMGASGSGKSTLGQLAAGLLHPDTGTVSLGKEVTYVSQYPEHQFIEETVFRDIRYGLHRKKYNDQEIMIKVKKALEEVGLDFEQYKDRSPFQLSGGEKKRVALAEAIILESKVLILDEPTAGLDPLTRVKFLALLTSLQRSRQLTIMFITHHLQDALEHADRLIVLKHGQLIYDLQVTEIRSVLEDPDFPLQSTPLLRLHKELEAFFFDKIDPELVQEHPFLTFIANRLTRT